MKSSRPGLFLFLTALWGVAGCGSETVPEDPAAQEWQGYTLDGDEATTVRTTAGSVWGGAGRLTEVVAIGTETLGENDLLARVPGSFEGSPMWGSMQPRAICW
jgi:hypothetical protein